MNTVLRWSARLKMLVTVLGVAAAVYGVIGGHWLWAVAAAVVVVGVVANAVLLLASLLIAIILGAWPATIVAAIGLLIEGGTRLRIRLAPSRPWHETALAAHVSALPPDIRHSLESVGRRVDTSVLLATAIDDDPLRWPLEPASTPAGDNSEGGLVAGTCWTVVAAEAALVASHQGDGIGVDAHLLAAIATLLPHSLAKNRVDADTNHQPSVTAGGFPTNQLYDLIRWAIKQPGGELLLSRMELATRKSGPAPHQVLNDGVWRRLGAPVGRGDSHDRT